MITIGDAIHAINPNVSYRRGETVDSIIWAEGSPVIEAQAITDKLAELQAAEPMRLLRLERTKLLQQSDWMANSDVVMTDEWKSYRQALRDLPETQTPALDDNGKLINVEWPTPPGETSVS